MANTATYKRNKSNNGQFESKVISFGQKQINEEIELKKILYKTENSTMFQHSKKTDNGHFNRFV